MNCNECGDEHYILIGCCNGYQCGCMGQPVNITNCKKCNPEGDKPIKGSLSEYAEIFEYIKGI